MLTISYEIAWCHNPDHNTPVGTIACTAAEMRFLRTEEGRTKRERTKNWRVLR
jgi:hypothetical protein